MSARQLNRALLLEAPQETGDGAGGRYKAWVVLGTLWAEVRPGAGNQAAGEEVVLARTTCRIVVRGAPVGSSQRPKPGQRFREGTRLFSILAVFEADAEGRFLTCYAREEVAA